jgi:hypothetical protein
MVYMFIIIRDMRYMYIHTVSVPKHHDIKACKNNGGKIHELASVPKWARD